MTLHRLRYTGEQAVTFQAPSVGYVEPGGTLSVGDDLLPGFQRRADVEHPAECPCGNGGVSEDSTDQDGETSGGGRPGRRGRSGSPIGKGSAGGIGGM